MVPRITQAQRSEPQAPADPAAAVQARRYNRPQRLHSVLELLHHPLCLLRKDNTSLHLSTAAVRIFKHLLQALLRLIADYA